MTGDSARRGFDYKGEPYVDEHLPDGTIKRTQLGVVILGLSRLLLYLM